MKTTFKVTALLLVMIALFSCESMDVMKRRYTGGFYVHHSNGNKAKESKQVKNEVSKPETVLAEVPATSEGKSELVTATNSSENNFASNEKQVTKSEAASSTVAEVETTEPAKTVATVKSKKDVKYTREEQKQLDYSAGGAAEVELIILILLSIFVPPLAVYLKKGAIDKWFWVTLILCLLAIFGVWAFYLGGLWFVAFVIALLVVLDVLA